MKEQICMVIIYKFWRESSTCQKRHFACMFRRNPLQWDMSAEGSGGDWTNKYRVVRVLKQNAVTGVYLAEHIRLKELRVIKTVQGGNGEESAVLREAALLKQLAHSGIPRIYDIEEWADGFYIVEEYIQGKSLTSYFQSKNPKKEEIIHLMVQLCDLLSYLHSRTPPLLHLDLKPDNLLIHGEILYLVDFGSALRKEGKAERAPLTGTPGYAAPECYAGEADARSDIYSAGKLLAYMISKCRKKGAGKKEWRGLEAVADRAARRKPADRYRTAQAMKRALRALDKRREGRKESCVIGLAGSGRRMGVTHFALSYAAFAKRRGERVLYLECNGSAMLEQAALNAEKQGDDGLLLYHGVAAAECRGVPGGTAACGYSVKNETDYYISCGYSMILADFGVLTTENSADFVRTDMCLFFAGEKDWELENTWRGLARLSGFEEKALLLLCYASEKRFRAFSAGLPGISCRRVPFVNGMETGGEREVMRSLMEEITERSQANVKFGTENT